MPAVKEILTEISRFTPDASVSPDEAVAHGAALRAGLLLSDGKSSPPFSIQNVNSHSLGIVATEPKTNRERTAVLIPRNTPLPAKAKRVFKTQKEGQKSIKVEVVEGESKNPEDCTPIGKCGVRDLPDNLPAKTPIEVQFQYDEAGRLEVRVKV